MLLEGGCTEAQRSLRTCTCIYRHGAGNVNLICPTDQVEKNTSCSISQRRLNHKSASFTLTKREKNNEVSDLRGSEVCRENLNMSHKTKR